MANLRTNLCFILVAFLAITNVYATNQGVGIYELKRGNFSVKVTNWGATVMSVILPDKNGKLDDVVLGYDSLDSYRNETTYFGAIVGRVANRIGGAEFNLNGTLYELVPNEGRNILHGGPKGFSNLIWNVDYYSTDSHITFSYNSFDGEEGFPGDLNVSVTYMLMGHNKLGLKMQAKPLNKATPVNLAFHVYWNLGGHNSGDILSHKVKIFGSKITPVNGQLIPTGDIVSVKGTPYDFLESQLISTQIDQLSNGYDVNYVLDDQGKVHFKRVAIVEEKKSGRKMELWSNKPGVQFYTGNMLNNVEGGKGGFVYKKFGGLVLETQGFPDSVNHPNFPSQIVLPGEIYEHVMVYRFTTT